MNAYFLIIISLFIFIVFFFFIISVLPAAVGRHVARTQTSVSRRYSIENLQHRRRATDFRTNNNNRSWRSSTAAGQIRRGVIARTRRHKQTAKKRTHNILYKERYYYTVRTIGMTYTYIVSSHDKETLLSLK